MHQRRQHGQVMHLVESLLSSSLAAEISVCTRQSRESPRPDAVSQAVHSSLAWRYRRSLYVVLAVRIDPIVVVTLVYGRGVSSGRKWSEATALYARGMRTRSGWCDGGGGGNESDWMCVVSKIGCSCDVGVGSWVGSASLDRVDASCALLPGTRTRMFAKSRSYQVRDAT